MCITPKQPKPTIVENTNAGAQAAADAAVNARRSATGFQSSILGGLTDPTAPTLGRQLLLGSGG